MYLGNENKVKFSERVLNILNTSTFKAILKLVIVCIQGVLLFCQIKYDLDILCLPNVCLCILQMFIKA